ncbi:MAG: proton-conducting transporter membrane subunit [candidate division WOR-3 bacterium]
MEGKLLPLFVALPLGGAFLVPLLSKLWSRFADLIANIVVSALLGISIYGLLIVNAAGLPMHYWVGGWRVIGIAMWFDPLTALIVLVINIVGLCATIYSVRYLDRYTTGRWKFFTLLLLLIAGLNGLAISGDLFNMYVFIEISAIASYALVAFGTEEEEVEAAFKYMVLGEVGGAVLLFGIALLYARASTLNLAHLSQVLAGMGRTPFYWFVIATLLVGFAIKMGMEPFHAWLADAHFSAPAPISAMLSGVFIKVTGVYGMCRLMFNVFGVSRAETPAFFNLLIAFGAVSMVLGGLLAYSQKDYKRLLAYSSISQIGYILVALGIGNFWGVAGAMFHILAHALGKGTLFLSAGSVERQTGTRDLEQLKGLERTMPVTSWSHILASFSMAGIPPFAGFFSKLFIIIGAISARMYWLAFLAALFSAVTLGYLTKVVNQAFFAKKDETPTRAKESPALMVMAMMVLVILTLVVGLGFKGVLDHLVGPAAKVLLNGLEYARLVLGG